MSASESYHEEEILGKAYDARLMRRLLTYLQPYRVQVFWSIILLVIATALQLSGPVLVQIAIDKYIAVGDTAGLLRIALLYFGVLATSFVLGYLQFYTMADKPFFCIEPWMGHPNALNALTGAHWLAPGEVTHGVFEVRANVERPR